MQPLPHTDLDGSEWLFIWMVNGEANSVYEIGGVRLYQAKGPTWNEEIPAVDFPF